jgi:hypothetical protein
VQDNPQQELSKDESFPTVTQEQRKDLQQQLEQILNQEKNLQLNQEESGSYAPFFMEEPQGQPSPSKDAKKIDINISNMDFYEYGDNIDSDYTYYTKYDELITKLFDNNKDFGTWTALRELGVDFSLYEEKIISELLSLLSLLVLLLLKLSNDLTSLFLVLKIIIIIISIIIIKLSNDLTSLFLVLKIIIIIISIIIKIIRRSYFLVKPKNMQKFLLQKLIKV